MKYPIFLMLLLFASACSTPSNLLRVSPSDDLNKIIEEAEDGATIRLQKKTYQISQRINLINKQELSIDGRGAQIILNDPDSDVMLIENCEAIVLKNFMAKHVDPQGPVGCTGSVIQISNSSDVFLEKCELNGSGIVGISAYESGDLKVKDCHFHHNSDYAIIYMGPSISLAGNLFEHNGNNNAIYFKYLPEGEAAGWPPTDKITADTQKKGLLMRDNVFK